MKTMNTSICSPISNDLPNELDRQPDERSQTLSNTEALSTLACCSHTCDCSGSWSTSLALVWAIYVCVNGFITIGLLACWLLLRGVRLFSVARPNCVSLLLFPNGGSLQPPQHHTGTRDWALLRLCRICPNGMPPVPPFGLQSRRPCRQGPGRRAIAFGDGRVDGPVPGKPSACGSNNPDRLARHHLPAQGACHHRDCGGPAYRAGAGHQPACRSCPTRFGEAASIERCCSTGTPNLNLYEWNQRGVEMSRSRGYLHAFRPLASRLRNCGPRPSHRSSDSGCGRGAPGLVVVVPVPPLVRLGLGVTFGPVLPSLLTAKSGVMSR